ncbi:unnamed protein product [Clonostachys rosea]|uniref:SMP-30/Gluconolactonase/LRE-like region domain-containing protein n=1 Tax=Bionectria ochroleuca TaxID=29856 RepID=A0ABY6U287_BIOOC|nr:unnamed protein product [Clonostachys rosea]
MPSLAPLVPSVLLLGAAHLTGALQVRQLYQFPEATFIENIAVRPNGHLLLNTFANASTYTLDPNAEDPTAELIAQVPGITGLTGIAEVAKDVFAVSGGISDVANYAFEAGTAQIAIVSFKKCEKDGKPTVKTVAKGGNTTMLNGMTALPKHPHIVLHAGSKEGNIFRTNTATGTFDIAFQDEKLGVSANASVPLGINGLHVHGDYLYFTNSAQQFFGRVKITETGDRAGDIEEIAHVGTVSGGAAYDDFSLARDGTAYIGLHPHFLVKVTTDGEQTVLVDDSGDIVLAGPTSTALSKDEKTVYVVTGGTSEASGGKGQVVAVTL